MIINEFNTEKDLFNFYPKDKYFKLKDIFNDYWDDFLLFANIRNLTIRQVVKHEVNKMMICKTPILGYSFYHCPNCDNHIHVYNTCKSRFL